jgi:hypothetical protein
MLLHQRERRDVDDFVGHGRDLATRPLHLWSSAA